MAKTVKTKTSATKTAAKKATATKATAKKTTATKPTTKTTTTEITVSGNKKIATLQKEFNKKFPYIRLGIFYSYARNAVKKGETITNIDGDKTLASVRRADSGGSISISGNKKVKSVEKELIRYSAYTAKYAIRTRKGTVITPAEHLTK